LIDLKTEKCVYSCHAFKNKNYQITPATLFTTILHHYYSSLSISNQSILLVNSDHLVWSEGWRPPGAQSAFIK